MAKPALARKVILVRRGRGWQACGDLDYATPARHRMDGCDCPRALDNQARVKGTLCFMTNDDADRFRKQADEARQQAEKAINPLDKEAWLRVAGEWIKLAQAAEDRLGKR